MTCSTTPRTLDYMEREGFHSNLIIPIDIGRFGSAVLFMVSRTQSRFDGNVMAVSMRLRDVVEPATRTYFACDELLNGGVLTDSASCPSSLPHTGVMTLAECQRRPHRARAHANERNHRRPTGRLSSSRASPQHVAESDAQARCSSRPQLIPRASPLRLSVRPD